MTYELEFSIGNTRCMLVDVQPFNTPAQRVGKYYEHCHPCFEFHYIESGKATYLCAEKCITILQDEILIIPPRMYHKEVLFNENNAKMTLSVDISPPSGSDTSHFYHIFSKDKAICIATNQAIKDGFLKIKQLAAKKEKSHTVREKMRALTHLLMAEFYDVLSNTSPKAATSQTDSKLSREYEIDTFLALNFTSHSSRDDLARKLHVSPRQLHRIMIKSYGKSYREKLVETRLEIAVSFLTSTDKSIADISEALGYSGVESFSAFIKRATGKSPSQIRKAGKR